MRVIGKTPLNVFCILVAFIIISLFSSLVFSYGQIEEPLSFLRIENSISSAYEALIIAENEGADIFQLLKDLNEACDLYTEVKYMNIDNGLNIQVEKLDICLSTSETVKKEAKILKDIAEKEMNYENSQKYVQSRLIMIILTFLGILIWRIASLFFEKNTLKMKIEVL